MHKQKLFDEAKAVLEMNDAGTHTRPAPGLYPHQWLWDSCFIAIGIAQYDPQRAVREMYSLLQGQWSNGMIPHMIFAERHGSERGHNLDAKFWDSGRSIHAPVNRQTSGITQPPLVAEACLKISKKLPKKAADDFLREVFPKIVHYHQWIYRERDKDNNGIVELFHPWETGLDNAPGWMAELSKVAPPLWIRFIELSMLDKLSEKVLRRDLKRVQSDERMSTSNALRLTHVALQLRKHDYDFRKIRQKPIFAIESLSFNSILIANNQALEEIAKKIQADIPHDLAHSMKLAKKGLQRLWHDDNKEFCHRNSITGTMVNIPGISRLLPLYSGSISARQAHALAVVLSDESKFNAAFPVPSVAKDTPFFNPRKYWQGPTWVNTNWLIIEGLEKYGFKKQAKDLREKTIAMVAQAGCFEYFSPEDGDGLGAENFSWTAALVLDMLNHKG